MSDRDISSKSNSSATGNYRSIKFSTKKNDKNRQNVLFFRIIWIAMIVLMSVMLAQYFIVGVNDMLAIGREEEKTVEIEISKNSKVDDVASILKDKGVIENKQFFILYSRVTKSYGNFIPGNFEVKTNLDYEALINYIQSNSNRLEKDIIDVTFQEGLNVLECAEWLERNEVCDKNEFLDLCKSNEFDDSYDFLKSISNTDDRYYKLEGYLFPDTYKFYKNERAKDTIKRFLNNYEKKITSKKKVEGFDSKVSIEDIAKQNGMTPEDMLTLASMIQAEAAEKDDMPNVSSVFHNRLSTVETEGVNKYGDFGLWMLGSDATVFYPYRTKAQVPIDIVDSFQSRYNTYNIKGLPAGPICNPGMDAIDAALNPNDTDYYYFCHSKDKKSYYAKTLDQHHINLSKAGLSS